MLLLLLGQGSIKENKLASVWEIFQQEFSSWQTGGFPIDKVWCTIFCHYSLLKQHAPVLADAIVDNMTSDGHLNQHASNFIEFIVFHINDLFSNLEIPHNDRYGTPFENPYKYFPCFPMKLVKAYYDMDDVSKKDDAFCRKLSNTHVILSPGIFTVFCRHRVCLGFSLMTSAESPKTPFEIYLRNFPHLLNQTRIIYDNCCNLHQYALNRQPARFAETIFLIDRLHFQDHSACTHGYRTHQLEL